MAMGTPHVKRWRRNIRLALFMMSHILAPRGQRLGKVRENLGNETPSRALEFCKFLEIFGRLKGKELGKCFATVVAPGALFRFTSNRFQVVNFWLKFGVSESAVFGAYLSK